MKEAVVPHCAVCLAVPSGAELNSWLLQCHLHTCVLFPPPHQAEARIQETVQLMFSEDQQGGSLEWLLEKLSSRFVSKDELQVLLRDLELRLLQNITHHITVTGQAPTSEAVLSAMNQAGISGITEAVSKQTGSASTIDTEYVYQCSENIMCLALPQMRHDCCHHHEAFFSFTLSEAFCSRAAHMSVCL